MIIKTHYKFKCWDYYVRWYNDKTWITVTVLGIIVKEDAGMGYRSYIFAHLLPSSISTSILSLFTPFKDLVSSYWSPCFGKILDDASAYHYLCTFLLVSYLYSFFQALNQWIIKIQKMNQLLYLVCYSVFPPIIDPSPQVWTIISVKILLVTQSSKN